MKRLVKRLMVVAGIVLVAACGEEAITEARAGAPKTSVKVITDWSGSDEGNRVVEVIVQGKQVICIETKDKYGGDWPTSEKPRGVSVGISCDWSPK